MNPKSKTASSFTRWRNTDDDNVSGTGLITEMNVTIHNDSSNCFDEQPTFTPGDKRGAPSGKIVYRAGASRIQMLAKRIAPISVTSENPGKYIQKSKSVKRKLLYDIEDSHQVCALKLSIHFYYYYYYL